MVEMKPRRSPRGFEPAAVHVTRESLPPCRQRLSSQRRRLNPIVLQNPRNRRAAQVQAKVHQGAAKPRVPPQRIFASHRQQLPDPVVGRAGTACRGSATTAVVLGRDLLAVPAHDRLGRRQRCRLRQPLSAQRSALFGEETTLRVREAQSPWVETAAKHAVLRPQVLDRLTLLTSQPAHDEENHELRRGR
jgi:hypothetical protein